ncbi:molybdopterin cofactor-binding domain-containing protein [Sphingomonas sp. BK580]|uniref:molybdopterin cofactor-binding domain-containing protein n=1 Tax=Sphingomonas sp. BK580 TaxID=2586972 RepID=UPI001610CFF2|nr:molybdopterin cofactor-binding domain-containing protein [Sphingomonas sp. BK580]MBB3695791.1 isoquinoline 1-oxidoreductase beta subunit [Sphingomonas sp. BK580]
MAALTRRKLLISGGAGVGLVVAWAVWPRQYGAALPTAPGEAAFGPFLKIARDGQVIVAVPQCEHGQGVYTTLAQIVADELGADWRTVGVEAAPLAPPYANPIGAAALFADAAAHVPERVRDELWTRDSLLVTAGSSSVRRFEQPLREAGAAARVLLCQAAAERWDADWQQCDTRAGFVTLGERRLRFAELAEAAAAGRVPDELPLRLGDEGRLSGESLPRLDSPAKVDGSANFVADVRLPDMVFASVRQGPQPGARLLSCDRAAAERVRGLLSVVTTDHWVAAVANDWWSANQGVIALAPRFARSGTMVDDAAIERALDAALDRAGEPVARAGDAAAALRGAGVIAAEYSVRPALHAALETPAATAHWRDGRLELWLATQAPTLARAAAARAVQLSERDVIVHALQVGGSFGAALEHDVAAQAAVLARALRRPVQLCWSRGEALLQDRVRAPAKARMRARLGPRGTILAWHAAIAAPPTGRALGERLLAGDPLRRVAAALPAGADRYATSGAVPPYRLPALAVDHHPVALDLPTGHLRGGADGYTAFFTECFIDELARAAGSEPMSYRVGLLGGDARLARCLTTAAELGGWSGGVPGSAQGIACHRLAGSAIAVLAEAEAGEGGAARVSRLVAAVDGGRAINPDVVRQQIEGGLVFGVAAATGAAAGYQDDLATVRHLGALELPTLATAPEISVELIASGADCGGISDLGVPAVAPAIANALFAATGARRRALPLRSS